MLILTEANSRIGTVAELTGGSSYTLETEPGAHSRHVEEVQRHRKDDEKVVIYNSYEWRPLRRDRQIRIWNGPTA